MELEFIEINRAKPIEAYIRHMNELVYVPILEEDTWNNLLDKVISLRTDDKYRKIAKEWVDMNRDIDNPEKLDEKILDKPLEKGEKIYAIFNIIE